jgi:hypothetical protein
VRFTEPDTETAGERNSARDRAKCGCGVVYGGLLELVLVSYRASPMVTLFNTCI